MEYNLQVTKEQLQDFHRRQSEINKLQHVLDNDIRIHKKDLKLRVWDILEWKDKNLGQEYLAYKSLWATSISFRKECIVACLVDNDPEIRNVYVNIPYDEIFSDDWKEAALEDYKKQQEQKEKELLMKKEQSQKEAEERERAEYERLKAKFEESPSAPPLTR